MVSPIDTATIASLDHGEALELQRVELDRTIALLKSLEPDDWTKRTDCPEWDVRQLYLHVLGACEAGARMRENVHQLSRALRRRREAGGALEAALSWVQVGERDHLTPAELVARLDAVAPATIRGRRRVPKVIRDTVKIPVDGPVRERWSLTYLTGTIYLRDLWMHRVDAARATGKPIELTSAHDGRIVADVVVEWARRHGRPFALELTGVAGGTFVHDDADGDAERRTLDAVEFARVLAGRATADGLLTTVVPF